MKVFVTSCVVCVQTIEFEWIRNELAHAGHHISVAQLTEVLDSQVCIGKNEIVTFHTM